MQNPFKMLGDINKMRKQAQAIQKALEGEEYEVTEGDVTVVITGNQKVKSITIGDEDHMNVVGAVNAAIKKSQQAAAAKLASMSQSMGDGS